MNSVDEGQSADAVDGPTNTTTPNDDVDISDGNQGNQNSAVDDADESPDTTEEKSFSSHAASPETSDTDLPAKVTHTDNGDEDKDSENESAHSDDQNPTDSNESGDLPCVPEDLKGIGIPTVTPSTGEGTYSSAINITFSGTQMTYSNWGKDNLSKSITPDYNPFIATNYVVPDNQRVKGTTYINLNETPKIEHLSSTNIMNFEASIDMSNMEKKWQNLTDFPTTWVYELPFSWSEISSESLKAPLEQKDGNGNVYGRYQIRQGCGTNSDKAYARIDFNQQYIDALKNQINAKMHFGFSFDTLPPTDNHRINGYTIPINGLAQQVALEYTSKLPTSTKDCIRSISSSGVSTSTCYISISTDQEIRDVYLYDKADGMVIDTSTIRILEGENNGYRNSFDFYGIYDPTSGSPSWTRTSAYGDSRYTPRYISGDISLEVPSNSDEYDLKVHFETLKKNNGYRHGCVWIRYQAELADTVTWDFDKNTYNQDVTNHVKLTHQNGPDRSLTFALQDNWGETRISPYLSKYGSLYKAHKYASEPNENSSNGACSIDELGNITSLSLGWEHAYTNLYKAPSCLDRTDSNSNDARVASYSITLNSQDASHQKTFLDGYKLHDTMSSGQRLIPESVIINAMGEHGQETVFAGDQWMKGDQGNSDYTKGTFSYDSQTLKSFDYIFPQDSGFKTFYITYLVNLDLKKNSDAQSYAINNTAETWWERNSGNAEEDARWRRLTYQKAQYLLKIHSDTYIEANLGLRVKKSNVTAPGWDAKDADGNILQVKPYDDTGSHLLVPWQLEVHLQSERDNHTDPNWGLDELRLKEDWVNANSDGSTTHMWYSKDTLNLKIQMKQVDETGKETWVTLKQGTNRSTDPGDYTIHSSIKDRYGRFWDYGPDLPTTGKVFPANWYRRNDLNLYYESDNYSLHQGVPRFAIEFHKKVSNDLRITYYTIFDKTPDVYVNYAKFNASLDGIKRNLETKSEYIYADNFSVGKSTDIDHYGKDYWDNRSKVGACPGVMNLDSEARCWKTNWTTWANAPKPWGQPKSNSSVDYWAKGISGQQDLSNKKLTYTDQMPQGWKLDQSTLKAYIATPNYQGGRIQTEDNVAEIDIAKSGDHFAIILPKDSDRLTEDGNAFTVTIDNMSSLQCVNKEGTGYPCEVPQKAIIKFTYDMYLSCDEAINKQWYKYGDTTSVANKATITLGDNEKGDSATGYATIYKSQSDSQVLNKTAATSQGGDATTVPQIKNGLLWYQLQLNRSRTTDLFSDGREYITFTDVLDPRAEFDRESLSARIGWKSSPVEENEGSTDTQHNTRNGVLVVDENGDPILIDGKEQRQSLSLYCYWYCGSDSGDSHGISSSVTVDTGKWNVNVSTQPKTGQQILTIQIPKELILQDRNNSSKYYKTTFDELVNLRIYYGVKFNALPAQTVTGISNSATLKSDLTYNADFTVQSVQMPKASFDANAIANLYLRKRDTQTKSALADAEFSLRQVDLTPFYQKRQKLNEDGSTVVGDDGEPVMEVAKDEQGNPVPYAPSSEEFKKAAKDYAEKLREGTSLPTTAIQWEEPFQDDNRTYLKSNDDGRADLPSLIPYANTLFILNEIKAPNHYERISRDMYIVSAVPSDYTFNNLTQIYEGINAVQFENEDGSKTSLDVADRIMPKFPSNGFEISIGNDHQSNIAWSKIDASANTDSENHTVSSPRYLAGSIWKITSSDTSGVYCNPDPSIMDELLPCTFYVQDNRQDGAIINNQQYVGDIDSTDGKLQFEGLRFGPTYTLTEVQAPDGFNILEHPLTFHIDNSNNPVWDSGDQLYDVLDQAGEVTGEKAIGNVPGVVLPSAGSTGPSRIARMLGMMLLVLSAGYTVYLMRKREQSPLSLS